MTYFDAVDENGKAITETTSTVEAVLSDNNQMSHYTVTTDFLYDDVSFDLANFERTTFLPGLGFA